MQILGNRKKLREYLCYDERINASFRNQTRLSRRQKRGYEWKSIVAYRKYQTSIGTLIGKIYKYRLFVLERKTGIHFESNPNIGKGLIIGHWGRIIINGEVEFGDNLFITHGVTIGRDIRGKRKGVPRFGNNVCIRANSTVVGNITIGDDVLIAPNTFVNFDVPNHSVVVGNPASIHHRDRATEGHIPLIKSEFVET